MHKDHPLKLWVEEHLRRMHLNRRRLVACLPIGYPSADAPLFALAMAAALRDAGALCAACKSKNRCQKPLLSLRSILESKYNKKFVFNDMTKACHVVEFKIQVSRCSDTHRQV
jgi:hypothetical protein